MGGSSSREKVANKKTVGNAATTSSVVAAAENSPANDDRPQSQVPATPPAPLSAEMEAEAKCAALSEQIIVFAQRAEELIAHIVAAHLDSPGDLSKLEEASTQLLVKLDSMDLSVAPHLRQNRKQIIVRLDQCTRDVR